LPREGVEKFLFEKTQKLFSDSLVLEKIISEPTTSISNWRNVNHKFSE
jgi:hypothetical protein